MSLRLTIVLDLFGRRTTRIIVTFRARSAIRALGNVLSIPGLGFAAASRLSRRYLVLILVSGGAY
jgi:hypothetical protein